MAGAVWVQTCAEADFDIATQTCSAPVWNAESTFPDLTLQEGSDLVGATAMLLAIAYCFKKLRQQAESL